MVLVNKIDSLYETMNKIKSVNKRIATNFFVLEDKKTLINNKELYMTKFDNLILIFIKNPRFYRLYYYTNDIKCLKNGLMKLDFNYDKKIVTDIVGKKKDLAHVTDIFLESGFNLITTFYRMSKTNHNNFNYYYDKANDIKYAENEDIQSIYHKIKKNFNEITEHLPSIEDIKSDIEKRNILLVKKNGNIIAYLIFNTIGKTSIFRYWYVDKAYRGKKIGLSLINKYFYECKDVKRFILWVESCNNDAIKKYLNNDFKYDGLVDNIIVK